MEEIKKFFENINHEKIIQSIAVVLICIVIYKFISYLLKKSEKQDKLKLFTSKKSKTYIKLIRSIVRYAFLVITILVLLQINGVDVTSVLAGVGILGAVFGLAIQDWLKDIIRGSTILSDNYFSVGDIVKYKDYEGKVLVIGLKTTKIQDIKTGYIISIANRNIEEVQLVSNLVYINIPMPYEVDVKKAEECVNRIIESIKNNDNVTECRYLGINEMAESSIKYLVEINCLPSFKLQVRRDALKSILEQMEKDGISVPYNQIDVHNK